MTDVQIENLRPAVRTKLRNKKMSYQEALRDARRVGSARVEGLPYLAQVVASLATVHAINPQLVFDGAVKSDLTADQVRKLDPFQLGDLMFV